MKITKKAKSNLIFWGIALSLIAFLFFTSAGSSLRSWMMSFTLRTPEVNTSKIEEIDDQFIEIDWMVISTEGEKVWLSSIDKPIFLNIWATWCGPCRSEMPSIVELQKKLGDRVEFVLVSPSEGLKIIKNYKESKDINFPLYINGSIIPGNLVSNAYPTTFIIDQHKHIVHKWVGAYNWDEPTIEKLLKELSE